MKKFLLIVGGIVCLGSLILSWITIRDNQKLINRRKAWREKNGLTKNN